MSDGRLKLYTRQSQIKTAIEGIGTAIESSRHCQLKPQQERLEGLWKEFVNNHDRILKEHGPKDDEYFNYKTFEKLDAAVRHISQSINWILTNAAEMSQQKDLDVEIPPDQLQEANNKIMMLERQIEELNRSRQIKSVPPIDPEDSSTQNMINQPQLQLQQTNRNSMQTRALISEFQRCVRRLKAQFEDVDNISEKFILEEAKESWQKQQDNINNIYMKLRVDHLMLDEQMVQDNEEIGNLHQLAKRKILKKLYELAEVKKCVKLNEIRIPQFNGNIEEWSSFHDMYKKLVHENNTLSNVEKMCHLKSLVKNDALKIIKHLAVSEVNYEAAWNILNQRFGNKRILFQSLIDRILDQPHVNSNNASMLKSLHDVTNESMQGLKAMEYNIEGTDAVIARIIIRKLDKEGLILYEQHTKKSKEIQVLDDVLQFLEQHYQSLEAAKTRRTHNFSNYNNFNDKQRLHTKAMALFTEKDSCLYCKKVGHTTDICRKFLSLEVKERHTWAKATKTCFKCLKHAFSSKCENKATCATCGMAHHSLLHIASTTKACTTNTAKNVLLATAQVRMNTKTGEKIILKALIDQGSQTTFISEEAAQMLQLQRMKINTELHGIGNVLLGVAKAKVKIELYPRFESSAKFEAEALVLPTLSYVHPDSSFRHEVKEWQKYRLADPNFNKAERIDVVIGGDLFVEILQSGIRKKNGILGQNSKLGLILSGPLQVKQPKNRRSVNMTTNIERFWEIEEVSNDNTIQHEDEICMEKFANTTTRDEKGRYIVKLPFKEDKVLGDSYKKAVARFIGLEKRLDANKDLKQKYVEFMDEYLSRGDMVEVPNCKNGKYYLPHQPVVRESSTTTKLRVVFDASSKTTNGKSLNDVLYVGPRLQKDVFDILIKFRIHKYTITADVEKMYRQIKMHEEDQDYQHIVWRKLKDSPIKEYKLTTVTYGTASAPFLAVRTLIKIAQECADENLKRIIREDFYMDDLLTGADTIQECNNIRNSISQHLEKYGFHLRKWCSNSKSIVEQTDQTRKNEIIDIQENDNIKTLGMCWSPVTDTFSFKINNKEVKRVTKRLALSQLAKIFDPIGVLTPITVTAKLFIQQLWIMNLDWDEVLDDNLQEKWNNLVKNLHAVENLKIPRWINTTSQSKIQVFGFADASEKAYAAVIYVKSVDGMSLLAAKSKVNPIKNRKTLPKLELCAAQLLVRLCTRILGIINMRAEVHLWSDSMITLAWIMNNKSKDKFIRTRVSEIKAAFPSAEWRYVASKENPADIGSRGIPPEKLCGSAFWWNGPDWLRGEKSDWPSAQKTTVVAATTMVTNHANRVSESLQKFSSFRKSRRILAYVLRFIKKLKGIRNLPEYLTVEEFKEAERWIIKLHQTNEWHTELIDLNNGKQVNHRHKLSSLHPYVDENGVMRVGGRLHLSNLPQNQKHPVIIQTSAVAYQIINDAHKDTLHGGRRLVENTIKRKFWIINGKNCIKKVIRSCTICIRYRHETKQQLMGILPECRVNISFPFDHCGVDYAGPMQIKFSNGKGQKAYKGYVVVFICMTTKAVHLEAVSSLTTDAFLAALKRFFARRGKSSHMYSDNGTNFIGAIRHLDKDFAEAIKQNKELAPILEEQQVKWHFIPAASPHFGGIWEAAVKSMKHHLKRVIGDAKLTFEELTTLLAQIEAVLNSRPLRALDESPDDLDILTPGHFLIGRPMIDCPEPNDDRRIGCLDRWKFIQKLKSHFWKQWKADYLTSLQQRHKWKKVKENVQEGQIVIIKNEETHPARWPLGRITATHPGYDGLVRAVTVKTGNNEIKRPITKVCPLDIATKDRVPPHSTACNVVRKKPKGLKLNLTTVLAVIFLMISAVSTQSAKIGGTVNELKSTAVYLDNIGSVNVVSSSWNIIIYFNIDPFLKVIKESEEVIKIMKITCTKLQTFEDQCNHILDAMERQIQNMKKTNKYMFPQNIKRNKRALLEFVGSIQHVLFGTMDADDRRELENNMRNMLENQYNLKYLIKKQTSVVDSTLNILRRTSDEINDGFRSITERVNNITETMKEVYFVYRESIKFFMVTKELQMMIDENEKIQAEIVEMLIDINHGKLNPALISPIQMQDEVNKVREHIPKHLSLPGKKFDQLRTIYRLMTAKATMIENQLVVSASVPLFNHHISQLHRIIPIPIEAMGTRMIIQPRGHYLVYNFNTDSYHIMSQSELNNCQKVSDEEFVCEGGWPWIEANDNSCELSALKPQSKPSCQFKETKMKFFWMKLHQSNKWIFQLFNETTAHIQCQPNQQKIIKLPPLGIMTLDPGCDVRAQGATMTAPYTVESKRIIEDMTMQPINVDQISELSMMPLGPTMKNHSNLIQELMRQLDEIRKENTELRGLNFHHISGHISLILGLILSIIFIIFAIRKIVSIRKVRALNFAS